MGDVRDVARAALFFASDDARFITGTERVVGSTTLRSREVAGDGSSHPVARMTSSGRAS